jgi:hypothetical protein
MPRKRNPMLSRQKREALARELGGGLHADATVDELLEYMRSIESRGRIAYDDDLEEDPTTPKPDLEDLWDELWINYGDDTRNPYMGDAVELAKQRKYDEERRRWEREGRRGPPPAPPRSRQRNPFRINYGNGQVSRTFTSHREALRELNSIEQYREFARIQRQDPDTGDWFTRPSDQAEKRKKSNPIVSQQEVERLYNEHKRLEVAAEIAYDNGEDTTDLDAKVEAAWRAYSEAHEARRKFAPASVQEIDHLGRYYPEPYENPSRAKNPTGREGSLSRRISKV